MADAKDKTAELKDTLAEVAADLDADVVLYGGDIDSPMDYTLLKKVKKGRSSPNVLGRVDSSCRER